MYSIGAFEAKTHLSDLLKRVGEGETIGNVQLFRAEHVPCIKELEGECGILDQLAARYICVGVIPRMD